MNNDNNILLPESLFDKETDKYLKGHAELEKQVMHEVNIHESCISERISKEDPFVDERLFIKKTSQADSSSIAKNILKIRDEYQSTTEAPIQFDFYISEFKKNDAISNEKEKTENESAIARTLIKDMQNNLFERELSWKMRIIDEERNKYLQDLLERINRYKKLVSIISPFLNELGFLWDMTKSIFQDRGFEILEQYADLLEQDESLQELAQLLGKHMREQRKLEKELSEKITINTEWKPSPAQKGQIAGLCTSNDISSVLPSELALFRNNATKKLFEKKFAEKSLLSFKYENVTPQTKAETITAEVSKEETKGPILICVDTSGSMHGTPENIAKTATFALAKAAIEENRKCYLISFSTGIETLDLTAKNENALTRLVSFLRMGFYGGTDATPALLHSINLLQQNDWQNADVLMVSDFIMPYLPEQTIKEIDLQKEKKTKFHSLVIGRSGNANIIQCFDHNWSYNLGDPNASRKLVEQIRTIKGGEHDA